ncbi:ABC transporter substrate-binding protein [Paenibacillus cremeus]|uniref:ABC transporter substrate-binding protein n=1 Tax=Paenibacillus cremeus TaxID=2163881 RepID=A0A559KAN9_9BACL|nr:ABC transporter substrate-binding protein [Paenibacillus cremeus]TVY09200.1 ABC transporter substrate-binding protein [Paenibacillus cremeus]
MKRVKAGVVFTLVLALLGGCSTGGSGGAPAAGDSGSQKAAEGPLEIEMMTSQTNEVPDMNNEYYTELQKLTNTKLNISWVPDGNDYDTKFDLMISSGQLPEVIYARDYIRPTLISAIKQNAFWDLTPLLGDFSKYPNLKNKMTPNSWNYVKLDGKTWGIPRSRSLIDPGIKIRADWLEKLNIPQPKTLDEYKEALKKIVKSDPDGNGKDDTIGLIATGPQMSTIMAAFGALDPVYNSEGGMLRDILTPQFTSTVEWFRGLYADGLLPQEFSTLNDTQQKDLLRSGRAASYQASIYYDFVWTKDIQKVQPAGKLDTLQPMKGPGGITAVLDIGTRGAFYISKKVPKEKVERILAYFEKTASDELTNFGYWGKEGVHYKQVNGDKQLTDLGVKQINVTSLSPLTPAYTKWGKVDYSGVSRAENEAKEKAVANFEQVGKVNPFTWLYSPTWVQTWPKYDSEMKSMMIKAVAGQISMDDYKKYVDKLVNDPQLKKAFKEYADDYKSKTGK